jgi:type III secretion protein J
MRRLLCRTLLCRILLLTPLLLAACKEQTLYADLSERQANEVVAALREGGIDAQKLREEKAYAVQVGADDFSPAVQLLQAQGLPRESFDSLGQVFKREGFVSTPLEERARLLYALSQELSNTVASIDGVVAARVHLVVPEKHPLIDKPQPAAASVFIKHRPDADLALLTPKIRALIINSVEGLPPDKVTVALFPAAVAHNVAVPALAAVQRPTALWALSLTLGGLALVGGAWMLRARRPAAPAEPERAALVAHMETPHA